MASEEELQRIHQKLENDKKRHSDSTSGSRSASSQKSHPNNPFGASTFSELYQSDIVRSVMNNYPPEEARAPSHVESDAKNNTYGNRSPIPVFNLQSRHSAVY